MNVKNLNDKNKISHKMLVKRIAEECHLSESSVRTVLFGLRDIVTEEVGRDNVVNLYGLGMFFLKRQQVRYKFKNRDHREEKVVMSVNPHFRCSSALKGKVQVMNGMTPSFCHRSKERQAEYIHHHFGGTGEKTHLQGD